MKLFLLIVFTLILTSCSTIRTIYSRKVIPEKINKNECLPELVFEGNFNAKCKIFIDDTLFYNKRIQNENNNVIILAEVIKIPKIPNKIEIKIGIRTKKVISWNGRYKYIYIKKNGLLKPITCNISNIKRKYR